MTDSSAIPWQYESLTQACRRIKSGEWTALWLTEQLVARIQEFEPQLHSYARLRTNQALARAAQLDELQAAGAPLGPLHGVPIAVKDLLFIQGELVASGTLVMQDYRASYTATVVARLERAGAVVVGQTQLTEGAYGLHHPTITAPVNPWHPDFWPGVSSSGSAVAVAAGLAFAALGTDTGGSIRFPCACCGLVGIKPTYGRTSRYGAWALAPSLDHIGPMARSVADAARLLQVISGADPNDPSTLPAPVPNYAALRAGKLDGLRIGVDWSYISQGVDPAVVATVAATAELLKALGATICEVTMPAPARALVAGWGETCGVETAQVHAEFYPSQQAAYGPALRSLIELGRRTSPQRYRALEQLRSEFRQSLSALLQTVDVLLLPALPGPVPSLKVAEGAVGDDDARADFLTFTAPFDYSGHPTLSLPAGLESQSTRGQARLPRAVQLVGPLLGESLLIQIGSSLEHALGQHFGSLFTTGAYPGGGAG